MPNQTGDTAVLFVVPATAPQSVETEELIDRLRDEVVPAALGGSGLEVNVGGVTAIYNDLGDILGRRLPVFMAVVIGLSFLLLLVVFRSVLVPVKAALMNLLSIGAAYGVIVAVFQWGWLNELIGVDRTGPIQSFAPMMLFAILFGAVHGLRGVPHLPHPRGVPARHPTSRRTTRLWRPTGGVCAGTSRDEAAGRAGAPRRRQRAGSQLSSSMTRTAPQQDRTAEGPRSPAWG